MKGISIHMEQLVIIIICVIVLLAVVAFFLGLWDPSILLYQTKLRKACSVLQNNGCQSEYLDPVKFKSGIMPKELGLTGTQELYVSAVCNKILGATATPTERCLKACGCISTQ